MRKIRKNTQLTKRKEKYEISLPEIINSEVNFLVFPFFALTTKGLRRKTETEFINIVERGDQKVEVLWNVSANPKYGYPGPFDKKIHKAIEQIITEILRKNGKIENPIPLGSLYSLFKKAKTNTSGKEYRKIKKALVRITTTSILSKGTFYNKERKQWIEDIFHLYDRVVFKGEQLPNGKVADTNYLFLNSWYLQNLNSFYTKPIDFKYLQSLRSKIASRLYEILGVKFYGLRNKKQGFICYKYSTLSQLLPVTPQKYLSKAKQQLDPAHQELKRTEFLLNYKWSKNSGKDWFIFYWPGERVKKEMGGAKKEFIELPPEEESFSHTEEFSKPLTKTQANLVDHLVDLGVSEKVAQDLVKSSSQQVIKGWIKAIPYTKAEDKTAYLVKAIKEEWQLPEKYLKAKEERKKREKLEKARLDKERKEKEEQAKRKKETEKLDKIYNSLNPSRQKEVEREIRKRLSPFMKDQLEKDLKKGKIAKPIKAALKSKRREVVKDWLTSGKIKDRGGENENEA